MDKQYLLDSCTCIALFRGDKKVACKLNKVGFANCFISEITLAELKTGIYFAPDPKKKAAALDDFVSKVRVIPFGASLDLFAEERARLFKVGKKLSDFDLAIGCAAVSQGLICVTNNIAHFDRIKNIRIEDWVTKK